MKKSHISQPTTSITLFAKNKKCIGPVVAIALLIVVAVSSVIGFQTFFQSYQSGIQSKVETRSQTNVLDIVYVESNIEKTLIYINSKASTYTVINSVKINNNLCSLIGSDVVEINSVTQVSVSCLVSRNDEVEIVLITDNGVYSEKFLAK